MLRLEGLGLFLGMTLLYGVWDGSWWIYAILFLALDLSFAGYLAGPRIGAIVYNAALLFGITSASPNANLRLQLEYEF